MARSRPQGLCGQMCQEWQQRYNAESAQTTVIIIIICLFCLSLSAWSGWWWLVEQDWWQWWLWVVVMQNLRSSNFRLSSTSCFPCLLHRMLTGLSVRSCRKSILLFRMNCGEASQFHYLRYVYWSHLKLDFIQVLSSLLWCYWLGHMKGCKGCCSNNYLKFTFGEPDLMWSNFGKIGFLNAYKNVDGVIGGVVIVSARHKLGWSKSCNIVCMTIMASSVLHSIWCCIVVM